MKTFEVFLKESYVGKDGNIYASKSEAEKTIAKLNRLSDSQKVKHLKTAMSKQSLLFPVCFASIKPLVKN